MSNPPLEQLEQQLERAIENVRQVGSVFYIFLDFYYAEKDKFKKRKTFFARDW